MSFESRTTILGIHLKTMKLRPGDTLKGKYENSFVYSPDPHKKVISIGHQKNECHLTVASPRTVYLENSYTLNLINSPHEGSTLNLKGDKVNTKLTFPGEERVPLITLRTRFGKKRIIFIPDDN